MITRHLASGLGLCLLAASSTYADTVQYNASPISYPNVTTALATEFGANPVSETALTYYQVNGVGPATLDFRFKTDFGGFQFNFGAYKVTASLLAIDTSTDAGKIAYATQALASGNAGLIFNDVVDNPGATASVTMIAGDTIMGGDTLGFFLIPNNSLTDFQTNQGSFALTGLGNPSRWPFFGFSDANPGGLDQLMSFGGTSIITGNSTSMFAWEDLTRLAGAGSDNNFSDLIFTVEGVTATPPVVPEPATFAFGLALLGLTATSRFRSHRGTAKA